MEKDLLIKIYRSNCWADNISKLPAVLVRVDKVLFEDEKLREMLLDDLKKIDRVLGFRILPADEKPEDVPEYDLAHLLNGHLSEKSLYTKFNFKDEKFYSMCYFGKECCDQVLPADKYMYAFGAHTELRAYDYIFNGQTGNCTFGEERLDNICKLPTAETLQERKQPIKIIRHYAKARYDHSTAGMISYVFRNERQRMS